MSTTTNPATARLLAYLEVTGGIIYDAASRTQTAVKTGGLADDDPQAALAIQYAVEQIKRGQELLALVQISRDPDAREGAEYAQRELEDALRQATTRTRA